MIARQIVSTTLPPLKSTDTIERALHWMHDFHLAHLPIVEHGKLIGLVAEEDILNHHDHTDTLGQLQLSVSRPYVQDTDHIYDIVKAVAQKKLTAIPVIDKAEQFIGTISLESLLHYFAESGSLTETGSIVVLEMPRKDYVLSTIARITEAENVHILSSYITSPPDTETLELTLKLDSSQIQRVVATYERFGYHIKAAFEESDYIETLQQRYDALMSYLDI